MYVLKRGFVCDGHCRTGFTVSSVHYNPSLPSLLPPFLSLFSLPPSLLPPSPLSPFSQSPSHLSPLSLSSVPQLWSSILSLTHIMDPLSQLNATLTTGLPPLLLGEEALTPSLPTPPPPRVLTPSHRRS